MGLRAGDKRRGNEAARRRSPEDKNWARPAADAPDDRLMPMVNLTRIYTRTGDGGRTRLVDMSLTDKVDPRVTAYGEVEEANAAIGVALATGEFDDQVADVLGHIQNELFDLGADLGNPLATSYRWEPLRILQESVDRLEQWCDHFSAALPKLRSFILPGGTPGGAALHLARTITRRAERTAWLAVAQYGTQARDDDSSPEAPTDEHPAVDQPDPSPQDFSPEQGGVNPVAVSYLNRLSDLLFILTRTVNGTASERLWVPGGDRNPRVPGGDRGTTS
jgi:cob(I)alamin adenosyltransferase